MQVKGPELENYIIFHGTQTGEKLENDSHIALGALRMHTIDLSQRITDSGIQIKKMKKTIKEETVKYPVESI